MNSNQNAYNNITWTTHMVGVYRRAMKQFDPCPASRQRLTTELAAAEAALASMKATA